MALPAAIWSRLFVSEIGLFDRFLVEFPARALELDTALEQHVDPVGVFQCAVGALLDDQQGDGALSR